MNYQIASEKTLSEDDSWSDIKEDMYEECAKMGKIDSIYYSRSGGAVLSPGKRTFSVYVLFQTSEAASAAQVIRIILSLVSKRLPKLDASNV